MLRRYGSKQRSSGGLHGLHMTYSQLVVTHERILSTNGACCMMSRALSMKRLSFAMGLAIRCEKDACHTILSLRIPTLTGCPIQRVKMAEIAQLKARVNVFNKGNF